MTDRKHKLQEEWYQELGEHEYEKLMRREWENEVPQSRANSRQEANGRRTVYIIQTCHWEYNDSFNEHCPSGGKSVAAFTTREKAMQHLRVLARQTDEPLGIVEVYLDDERNNEEGAPHVRRTS